MEAYRKKVQRGLSPSMTVTQMDVQELESESLK